jgi:hypothetical protein
MPCSPRCARSGTRCAGSTTSAAKPSATCRTTCARRSPPPPAASRRWRPLGRRPGPRRRPPPRRAWRCATPATPPAWCKALGDLATLDEPSFQLRLERVDLRELLDDIADALRRAGHPRGVTLARVTTTRRWRSLDVELFERAVANLVDNALKFCGRGCRITLTATARDGRRGERGRHRPRHSRRRPRTCSTASTRRGTPWNPPRRHRQGPGPGHRQAHRRTARRRRWGFAALRGRARRSRCSCPRSDPPALQAIWRAKMHGAQTYGRHCENRLFSTESAVIAVHWPRCWPVSSMPSWAAAA